MTSKKECTKITVRKVKVVEETIDLNSIFPLHTVIHLHKPGVETWESIEEILKEHGIDINDMPQKFRDNVPYSLYEVKLNVQINLDGTIKILKAS